jgi:hypothetical protein
MTFPIDLLRTPSTIRQRCGFLLELARNDKLKHFALYEEKLDEVARLVTDETMQNYPSLNVPYHDRWGHFEAGGIKRLNILQRALNDCTRLERIRRRIGLVVVSVLLDAGAGSEWAYHEGSTSENFTRSEGLAVASIDLFFRGAFSASTSDLPRVDSDKLAHFSDEDLAKGFQVTESNPLIGITGRAALIRKLGKLVNLEEFVDQLIDISSNSELPASLLLRTVLEQFANIWPGRISLDGANLGDVGRHSQVPGEPPTTGLVPFHKLSQWLTYSLVAPLEEYGISVTGIDDLTGLAEYRNGGLFIDGGVLRPREPSTFTTAHEVYSELVVEWRALTISLLDIVAEKVRHNLGKSSDEFPLPRVLQGGTWSTGRKLAAMHRKNGEPPINIISDGTVF